MTKENSTIRGVFSYRPTAKTLYLTTLAAVAIAVTYALFLMPAGNTAVQASSNDDNIFTSEYNDLHMMVRAVTFGSSARYSLWAKGQISDDGNTTVNGDVGSPSGKLSLRADQVRGTIDNTSGNSKMSSKAMREVDLAFDAFSQLPCTNVDAVDLDGKSFGPGTYCLASARLAGQMTLDAHGDPGAVFMFRVLGPVSVKDGGSIQYANGAEGSNAFFFSETSVEIGSNAQFRASALSRGDITIGSGSAAGKVISDGDVYSRSAVLGERGTIEICKNQLAGTTGLEGLYFDFFVPGAPNSGFGAGIVRVPLGGCSGPLNLPAGPINIFEPGASTTAAGIEDFQNYTLVSVTSPQDSITNVNGPSRSFTTVVTGGTTAANERLIFVTNRYAITGYVEICKYRTNANDTDVTGTFSFRIDITGTTTYTTPVGQCTGPIFLVMPTTGGATTATVNVSELARNNFINTGANTIPAGALQAFTPATSISPDGTGTGGTARVTVAQTTNNLNETIVNFFNATTPGTVKICKIAGPGIPLGTRFDFTVAGTQGPLPGTATTQTVRVAAGPVGQGGFCNLASGTFIVGSAVTVTEILPPVDAVPGVPPGEIRVTRIQSTTPILAGPNLAARTITVRAGQFNGTVVTYTNIVFRPTLLKVCKVAGPGVAVGTNYTFNVSLNDPNGFYAGLNYQPQTVTVSAGPNNSQFGNCVFVNGPFDTIGNPPIGTFNVGQDVNIVETVPAGQAVFQISYVGTALSFTPPGTFVLRLSDPATNMAIFFNLVIPPTPAGANYVARADFDGNGSSDIAIAKPSQNLLNVTSRFQFQVTSRNINLGPGDRLVPGDYDGDKKTDYAVYNNGTWRIERSSDGGVSTFNWGIAGDKPVAADYDGDGKADIAAYRPSNGTWYSISSRDGSISVTQWGNSTDLVAPGDWDGDGKADIGIYRPSNGNWYILQSSGGGWYAPWGIAGDRPVPGDYDGDSKMDMAQYRESDHNWYIFNSRTHDYSIVNWGTAGDVPVPGDYDGDGKTDVAMYRPSSGQWFILQSSDGLYTDTIGGSSDIPVEGQYLPF